MLPATIAAPVLKSMLVTIVPAIEIWTMVTS